MQVVIGVDLIAELERARSDVDGLIIDTGHLLGATITAEGIETHTRADPLTSIGSDDLQGYLYRNSCPAQDLHIPAQLA